MIFHKDLTYKTLRRLYNSVKWPISKRWRSSRRWSGCFSSGSSEMDPVVQAAVVLDSRPTRSWLLCGRSILEWRSWTISALDSGAPRARSRTHRRAGQADSVCTARLSRDPVLSTCRETCRDRCSLDGCCSWMESFQYSAYRCFYGSDRRSALRCSEAVRQSEARI